MKANGNMFENLLQSMTNDVIDAIKLYYTLSKDSLPDVDNVGKCRRRLIVLSVKDGMFCKSYAWYSIAGFFSSPSFYSEHQIAHVIAWKYDDE